jgi:hypothetical protein
LSAVSFLYIHFLTSETSLIRMFHSLAHYSGILYRSLPLLALFCSNRRLHWDPLQQAEQQARQDDGGEHVSPSVLVCPLRAPSLMGREESRQRCGLIIRKAFYELTHAYIIKSRSFCLFLLLFVDRASICEHTIGSRL